MSSLFYRRWKQYFQMPIAESVERLSLSGYRYYGFLCREMNVHSAVELHYSNAEIAQATEIKDHKTISKVRNELQTARLIECHTVPPGVYAHIMLDQNGGRIPAPEGRTGIRRYVSNKRVRTTPDNEPATPAISSTAESSHPGASISTTETQTKVCRTHGRAIHWKRGREWLCETCHPNPHDFCPPTASEVGF